MSNYVRWSEIRAEHVRRAGGEEAIEAGKQELRAELRRREPPCQEAAEAPSGTDGPTTNSS
jgi:hypothetical protein